MVKPWFLDWDKWGWLFFSNLLTFSSTSDAVSSSLLHIKWSMPKITYKVAAKLSSQFHIWGLFWIFIRHFYLNMYTYYYKPQNSCKILGLHYKRCAILNFFSEATFTILKANCLVLLFILSPVVKFTQFLLHQPKISWKLSASAVWNDLTYWFWWKF